MNHIQKLVHGIDRFQQRYHVTAFTYAVIKKYSDDQAGYQAALLTYYGFLSLFPLLLVVATVTGILARDNPHLQTQIIKDMTAYFPVLGNQLAEHIQTLHKSGIALFIGVVFTLYGARGVAGAFLHGVNNIWRVPIRQRSGFPKSTIKSLGIVLIGGSGLLAASVLAGITTSVGHGFGFHLLSLAVNLFILFWVFTIMLNLSLPRHVTLKEIRSGAAVAAVGLTILQSLGGYLLARELKNLDALYSYFALSLGLLFWIYLQAQVLYYAIEVASVHTQKLWPRSLAGNLTAADKRAYEYQAAQEQMVKGQRIRTTFADPED